ncbi:hypothetical protein LTR84_007691 [Exophiala bonariae]|uniref:Uncharacterized protein n=1 Tax=Exophiala bonariae TaxID=1690606 RepID=A0AAV9NKW8_9EURO|nr:hypothetical protein LTR84_007691 [Exophiala bonariae]
MDPLIGAPGTTAKPSLHHDLLRRDSGQILMAPDYTCGYIDGRAVKCTNQGWPYCVPHTFPDLSAIYYTCEDSVIATLAVSTNPNGQVPARVWNTLLDNALSSGASASASAGITTSAQTQSTASRGSTGTTSASPTSTTSSVVQSITEGTLSRNTIIGIAVGGFAIICAVIGSGIWWCMRRRRRAHQASYRPPQGSYHYGAPPPMPPPSFVPPPYPHPGSVPKPFDGRPNPGYGAGGPTGQAHSHVNYHATSPVSPVGSPPPPPSRYELTSQTSMSVPTSRSELSSTPGAPRTYAELPAARELR